LFDMMLLLIKAMLTAGLVTLRLESRATRRPECVTRQ
jgi:hypothetical protein